MMIILQDLTGWERILERWGLPVAILIVFTLGIIAVVRKLWPLFSDYLTGLRKEAEEAHALSKAVIRESAQKAEERAKETERELKEQMKASHERFLTSLSDTEKRHEDGLRSLAETHLRAIRELADKIK
ncbi:MAG: hypothetical protein L0229_20260 [Blastocatellia bacterium]|nr:hypothetical protein [Blastocatellia bacterium]